jgi:putative FmdB family regulatory protein
MPTYEYRCAKGHPFERVQKMTDKPVAKCPQCGAKASREISGGQGLIFKGSGFYITDYGKDGKGPRKEPAAESSASTSEGSSTKDAPAAKADAPAKDAAKPAKKATTKSAE